MRRTSQSLLLLAALFFAAPLFAQGTLKNGWLEDTRNGYKLKVPEKWEAVPISVDEKWIVAKVLADRAVSIKKGEYSGAEQKPQLRVIVFSDDARKAKPADVKLEKVGESRAVIDASGMQIPYKDYKDYLKRNAQDGGYFFTTEKETKVGEVPCSQYEIKFEKLTVPRHVVTWVFRGDAADYAVEYEVLEDHWDKFMPVFMESLKSFKFVKRQSTAVGSGGTTGGGKADVGSSTSSSKREAWKALTAKERAERRKSTEEVRFQRVKSSLPGGWTIKTTPLFLVVSHTDPAFTDKVLEAASACRTWLDKNLGAVSDEYVMRAVIRVCADYDEYISFRKGSSDSYNPENREIVTFKGANMGMRKSGFDRVFAGMLGQYLADKDALIWPYAPDWVTTGLSEAIQAASIEGNTLKFAADVYENDVLKREAKGAPPTARKLMELPVEKFYESQVNGIYAARLVRHFLATKKDFIVNYLKASVEAGSDMSKVDLEGLKEAKTEEEEEAQAKEGRERAKKRSAELIQKVHAKACNWSEKEWQNLEAAFAAAIK